MVRVVKARETVGQQRTSAAAVSSILECFLSDRIRSKRARANLTVSVDIAYRRHEKPTEHGSWTLLEEEGRR